MSKEVTKKDGTFLPAEADSKLVKLDDEARADIGSDDWEGYEEPREALPIVTIRQKDKKDDSGLHIAEAGGFKCHDIIADATDVSGETGLTISVILDQKSRIYWEQDNFDAPACRSRDWKTGIGNPGGNCLICPLSQWKSNGERPDCADEINLLCYDHNQKNFYVVTLKRSGLKAYNTLKVLLKRSEVPIHFVRLVLKTEYRPDPQPHFVPIFEVLGTLDATMRAKMKELRKKLSATFGKTIDVAATHDQENGYSRPESSELPEGVTPVVPIDKDDLPF